MALEALVQNKLRSFLSVLGISVGIFSIVLVFTIVDSLERNVMDTFKTMGQNVIYVQKWPWSFGEDYPWWKYMGRPVPRIREAGDLADRLEEHNAFEAVDFFTRVNNRTIKANGNSISEIGGMAIGYDYSRINDVSVGRGRYFSEMESRLGQEVIILGHDIALNLFPGMDPIGKQVVFMGKQFRVIGVLERKGKSVLGESEDNMVMIPVEMLRKVQSLQRGDPSIAIKVKDEVSLDEAESIIRSNMRSIRRLRPTEDDDFALNRITMLTEIISNVFGQLKWAGFFIGLFSLLVGGFGIANIMFVSVRERTNIIGIQKSLGARNGFILFQFLTESIFLSILGGILGILFVFLLITLLKFFMEDFSLVFSLYNVFLGTGISAVIGLLFGLIPAFLASRLKPVDAIRTKI